MATDKKQEVSATVEQPPLAKDEEVKPPQAEKPVKEKKTKAPKEKKPKQAKTATHPPYFQMIKEALLALNEKNGSSPYAIAKYMEEKHKAVLPANFKKILGLQLKNSAARGKLMKIKASYELTETTSGKEENKKRVLKAAKGGGKETKIARLSTRKTRSVNKAEAMKKSSSTTTKKVGGGKKAKKATPAKPKQPKSIKSPAAKRTKKAAAVASAS